MSAIEVRLHESRDPLSIPVFSRQVSQQYFIFDAFVAGQRRVDLHPLVLPESAHRAAIEAAVAVARTIGKVAGRAHDEAAERAAYGLHPDVLALAAASHEAGDEASLVRVDLLLDEDGGWRACEINADCPGGHNEALGLPRLSQDAGFWEGTDPTRVVPAVTDRLAQLADGGTVALLYATAYAEDLQVCALLRRALLQRGVRAILSPPTAPHESGGRLYVGSEPVSALYRFFPTEYMEGQRNLPDLMRAIRAGKLRTLSSFTQIFAQSKLAFARAFSLREALSPVEQSDLVRFVPETRDLAEMERGRLLAERTDWVIKRALGRVGEEVFVGALIPEEGWPQLLDEIFGRLKEGEVWIAQRFVRQRPIPTPFGPRLVTLGAYVLDGEFVGYFARVSPESHVGHDALCLPVFVDRKPVRGSAEVAR